jgi:tetratricopeptide (TPR) repeat protein
MKTIILITAVIVVCFFSLCQAAEVIPLKKAYSLYYQGKIEAAIEMMEEYVKDNPDPAAFYFLGYAYYEKKQLDKAREYFTEAFRLKSFYSPMSQKK